MNQAAKTTFDHFFQTALNPEQQKVVDPKDGVLLVCAGAGSGKTRVITARIANLMINHGVQGKEIVALTFTNKAAKEMKERVRHFLPDAPELPYVGTFHSYCLRLLKSNLKHLQYDQFTLIDEDDQIKLIKKLLEKHALTKKVTPKTMISFISRVKNDALTAQEKEEQWAYDPFFKDLFMMYEHEKKLARCFDFDDLLTETLKLFQTQEEFRVDFQKNVRHLLVDEYQDTNKVQHALLKAMARNDKQAFAADSLCVVGDEDQSIYSWRGATVANIVNFKKDFPQALAITIEQNYRSAQPILQTANEIIKNNQFRNPKTLWSNKEASDRVRLISCASGYQESEAVALYIKQSAKLHKLNSHAILYRSHFQSRTIEEALIRHSIPYKIIGGIQFYDRLEIKDLLGYMRLVVNPYDRMALSRIINTPSRSFGPKFEETLFTLWDINPFLDFRGVLNEVKKDLSPAKAVILDTFLSIFDGLESDHMASEVLEQILTRTGYYAYLKDSYEKEESTAKIENIKEFIHGIFYFEQSSEEPLHRFLEEVALLQELMNTKHENNDYVVLMTLHAAKGLEFDTVILNGLEEGILPSTHSLFKPESIEEERRLLYVGITRARERLLLSHARYRYTYGQMTDQRPSRFIEELPEHLTKKADCSFWSTEHFNEYFSDWVHHRKSPQPQQSISKPTIVKPSSNSYPRTTSQVASQLNTLVSREKWHENQVVNHATFGAGVIEKVEKKVTKTYLTIRFPIGIKKLDSSFLS